MRIASENAFKMNVISNVVGTWDAAFMAGLWTCSVSLTRDLLHDLHGDAAAAQRWLREHAPSSTDVELVMSEIPGCNSIAAHDALYRCRGDVVDAIMFLTDAARTNLVPPPPTHAIRGVKRERSADEAED